MFTEKEKFLKENSKADRERFLKRKYREQQLKNRLARSADQYNYLLRLMEKSLALWQFYFGIQVAVAVYSLSTLGQVGKGSQGRDLTAQSLSGLE